MISIEADFLRELAEIETKTKNPTAF